MFQHNTLQVKGRVEVVPVPN